MAPPQVKDIFPQAVKVELPGGYPARGGAPKGDELLSPSSARCHGSPRTSCDATAAADASQKGAPHDDRSASRWTKISPPAPSPPPPPNLPEPPAWLNGFGRSQQGLAPEQCLRRATLRLAHGLEQGACHLSAACRTGSTTGSWPKLSPPHGIQRSSLIPWIDSLISVHEFPVIHRREFRHKLLQIFAFWWPPAAPSQFWPTQFPALSLKQGSKRRVRS